MRAELIHTLSLMLQCTTQISYIYHVRYLSVLRQTFRRQMTMYQVHTHILIVGAKIADRELCCVTTPGNSRTRGSLQLAVILVITYDMT